ncbi:hypothetical protein GGX14DRAFT_406064 [Mycena pura]|uniref:Uncharacterized protein n=1 Tax=Mycena pura TaxID=153505 RepID=A0AAD6UQV3_9AGAR|nr:hypothetical protein GGX14DRAFT_406064 [Mycena pura]
MHVRDGRPFVRRVVVRAGTMQAALGSAYETSSARRQVVSRTWSFARASVQAVLPRPAHASATPLPAPVICKCRPGGELNAALAARRAAARSNGPGAAVLSIDRPMRVAMEMLGYHETNHGFKVMASRGDQRKGLWGGQTIMDERSGTSYLGTASLKALSQVIADVPHILFAEKLVAAYSEGQSCVDHP